MFAIRNRQGKILLHAKSFYPAGIFRLPGGGIHWNEKVADALWREVEEETGLRVQVEKFVALIEYQAQRKRTAYPTYLFLLSTEDGQAQSQDANEKIAAFKTVTLEELRATIAHLHNLPAEWRMWGQYRAVAHELIVETLAKG